MEDVAYLINETYAEDVIGQQIPIRTKNEIFVEVTSSTRAEFFGAGKEGLRPDFVLKTAAINYSDEKELEYHNELYSIYRTYLIEKFDVIELYVNKKVGNV